MKFNSHVFFRPKYLKANAMTVTLPQSQTDLPRLVELASQGEDVLITVDGRPKARITRAVEPARPRQLSRPEMEQWLAELAQLRHASSTSKVRLIVERILDEDRADR